MARKNILQGLMEAPPAPQPPAQSQTEGADHGPRSSRGAIGAVSRSIADLKARAVVELDPQVIEAAGMQDRLETDEAEDAGLRQSIAEYGQQVPVLVRPHPTEEGRYQIVYGRRRVLAMRALGQPVKALIRDLDDRELVLAQGQENTARRDLSFIEKVNFARQMVNAGYDRKAICDALSVDKTLISRMLSVAEGVPLDLIEAIGAAPSIGRERWSALADLIDAYQPDIAALQTVAVFSDSQGSDARFQAVFAHLTKEDADEAPTPTARAPKAPPAQITDRDGNAFAQTKRDKNYLTLKLKLSQTKGFEAWLVEELPALLAEWQTTQHPADE